MTTAAIAKVRACGGTHTSNVSCHPVSWKMRARARARLTTIVRAAPSKTVKPRPKPQAEPILPWLQLIDRIEQARAAAEAKATRLTRMGRSVGVGTQWVRSVGIRMVGMMSFGGTCRVRGRSRHGMMIEHVSSVGVRVGSVARVGRSERGVLYEREPLVSPLSMPHAQPPRVRHECGEDANRIKDETRECQTTDGADSASGIAAPGRWRDVRQRGANARAVDARAPRGQVIVGAIERRVCERLYTLGQGRPGVGGIRDANLER